MKATAFRCRSALLWSFAVATLFHPLAGGSWPGGEASGGTGGAKDPRFFGTYYGTFKTQICKKYKVKFLGITVKKGTKCETVEIKNIRLRLDYHETAKGAGFSGGGGGTYKGREIPFAVAGVVAAKGKAWGILNLMQKNLVTERGYSYLSPDGLALSVSVMGRTVVLRKDAGPNTAPKAKITAPAAQQALQHGQTYPFAAKITDEEQTGFSAERLVWRSDRDGEFADHSLAVFHNSLSPGKHVITFEATDDGGLTAKDSIVVTVVNKPPDTPVIVQPLTKDKLYATCPILFQGKAYDHEEGWLGYKALAWSSDKEGALGTGNKLSAALKTPGMHKIRLKATDSTGQSSVAERKVVVRPYTGNAPPQVTIDEPQHMKWAAIAVQTGKELTFRGTAKDLEDAFNKLKLEWRIRPITAGPFSVVPKVFGTGTKATHKLVVQGGKTTTYVITFAAKDTAGLEGRASIKLIVMPHTIQ